MLGKTLTSIATLATAAMALPLASPGGAPPDGVNSTAAAPPPEYVPMSDFDFQSLNLALNQEWIELDLFHYGLARFSPEEFEAVGINAEMQFLIEFMADQEVAHATLISNILQEAGAKQCEYVYDFNTVQEYVQFCAILTRFGESGVYGFINHLVSRPAAQLLLQSITTEARQQMIFRQLAGAFPMPVDFEAGIPQAWAWTLLSPYLKSCPAENPRIEFPIFPALTFTQPGCLYANGFNASITHNRTAFVTPGQTTIEFSWKDAGYNVSYDNSYSTVYGANVTDPTPKYCAWVNQLNYTTVPFMATGNNSGSCLVPEGQVFQGQVEGTQQIINGTAFVALITEDKFFTPYNLSLINDIMVAGPAIVLNG